LLALLALRAYPPGGLNTSRGAECRRDLTWPHSNITFV